MMLNEVVDEKAIGLPITFCRYMDCNKRYIISTLSSNYNTNLPVFKQNILILENKIFY